MKAKDIKARIFWVPSWGLSLFATFFTAFLMSIINDIGDNYAYITYVVLIPAACFFICRNDPKSVWYVPLLCNAVSLLPAIFDEGFRTTSMWVFFSIGWGLSIITAIIGAMTGRRAANQG